MKSENQKLHILGKVTATIANKISEKNNITLKPGELFLFVGYNFYEYNIGDFFDIAINEADKKWKSDYKIKLKKIFDEYGRPHQSIPEGYKTICLFECKPSFPDVIKKLPTLKTWNFEKTGIFLCNHENINLLRSPFADNQIFITLEKMIITKMAMDNKQSFTMQELENILSSDVSQLIIDNMLISGSIRKNNELLELAS